LKETKPGDASHVQINGGMDVKTGKGLVVSVEAVKKPGNATKA